MENARILIVDDDVDLTKVLKITLESRKYAVDTAASRAEGMEKARALKPDLFILVLHFLSSTTMPPSYSLPGACRCRSTHKAWLSTRYDTR